MVNSAKRYGIEVEDPELELRLRRLELETEKRQLANFQNEEPAQRRARLDVPRVTGLRLDNSIVGGLAVVWNALDSIVSQYELQISPSKSFAVNTDTFKTNEPHFVFPNDLNPLNVFYVRARGLGTRVKGNVRSDGAWSATLNTSTGQATFDNLLAGSASNITVTSQTSGFNPASIPSGGSGNYAGTKLDLPVTTEMILFGFAKIDYDIDISVRLTVEVIVDGEVKQSYENQIDKRTVGRLTVPGLGFPQVLGPGFHTFSLRASLNGATAVTPVEFTLAVWEARR